MRNSTKLKTLLLKYTIQLDMTEDDIFQLTLTNKQSGKAQLFEGESYGKALGMAYSYLLKELKSPLNYA